MGPHFCGPQDVSLRDAVQCAFYPRYTTANAESDCDWETEKESEEEEDEVSCETVKTGRRDSQDLTGDGDSLLLPADSSGGEELLLLLRQADELHQGDKQSKQEGFQRLLNNKLAVMCPSPPSALPSRGQWLVHQASGLWQVFPGWLLKHSVPYLRCEAPLSRL